MRPKVGSKKDPKEKDFSSSSSARTDETEGNKGMELSDVFLWHDDHTDSQDWYEKKTSIGNQLAKKNVRSVACDMPGYGRSEGRRSSRGARISPGARFKNNCLKS